MKPTARQCTSPARRLAVRVSGIAAVLTCGALGGADGAAGQSSSFQAGQPVPPVRLERSQEIALAKSAAPAAVSTGATIHVLEGEDWVIAEKGTTGVECWVARSRPNSIEPHCFDAEGAATILPIHMHEARLRLQGRSKAEIDGEIAAGVVSGRFRLPARPAMSYMMSAGQVLVSDEGQNVGRWQPHLMIYYPYLQAESLGLYGEASTDAAIVVDPGKALSNIMIVVRSFVDPVTRDAGK
jgi:hypothetical protein